MLDRGRVRVEENLWSNGEDLQDGTLVARYLVVGDPQRVVRASETARCGFATGKIGAARTSYLAMIGRVRDIAGKSERLIERAS